MSKNKILLVDTTNNKIPILYLEFVKPIEKILEEENLSFEITKLKEIKKINFDNFSHIIFSGTALKDFEYEKEILTFDLKKLKEELLKKNVIGICSGAQILSKFFNLNLIKKKVVELEVLEILKEDEILKNVNLKEKVYQLSSYEILENDNFFVLAKTKSKNQILKHNQKNIYLFNFHIEVRFNQILKNFTTQN